MVTEVGIQVSADGVRIGATVGTPLGIDYESRALNNNLTLAQRISNLERR